jgi:type II secretory pathway pseudopilin PulG
MFKPLVTITLVLYGVSMNSITLYKLSRMHERQMAGFFLELVAVVAMLGSLAAVAIPQAGQMVSGSRALAREAELDKVQAAVLRMLRDSDTGSLEPVGPTAETDRVRTKDVPSLILTDYLTTRHNHEVKLDGAYGFTSDGTVIPMAP